MRIKVLSGPAVTLALLLVGWLTGAGDGRRPDVSGREVKGTTDASVLPGRLSALEDQFVETWWSVLKKYACLTCHGKSNGSMLHLPQDPREAFRYLLEHDFFSPLNASSLIARMRLPDPAKRMPPDPFPPVPADLVEKLEAFSLEVVNECARLGIKPDEIFPYSLTPPYSGNPPPPGDNTILSFYQLRKKVRAVFESDWTKDGRDLFQEYIALFGGADFRRFFSEVNRPTANYLTALNMLAKDMSSQSFVTRTGPFRGFPENLPDPSRLSHLTPEYREAIRTLYRRILFRNPSETEMISAFHLLQRVAKEVKVKVPADYTLTFEVTAEDPEGRRSSERVAITVLATPCALFQEWIDQTPEGQGQEVKRELSQTFHFKPGADNQWIRISNAGTYGVVSVSRIDLIGPLPKENTITLKPTDPSALVIGAWRKIGTGYHDNDEHKGGSEIYFPISVPEEGRYKVVIVSNGLNGRRMARAVPIEVASQSPDGVVLPPPAPKPTKGEARFLIDQTVDTIPFWDSKAAFRFADKDQGVEINNQGTIRTVVADAVRFVPVDGGPSLLIRSTDAEGHQNWQSFDPGGFDAYNTIGPKLLSDANKRKGELKLIYRPSLNPSWKPDQFYRLEVTYPAKEGNETQTPLIVRAAASYPILRIRSPLRVRAGATVTLDASESFNLQGQELRFSWRQVDGPKAELKDSNSPTLAFVAPLPNPVQAAWESLCRILTMHPDFIFTRPPSVTTVTDPEDRRRLQLVKIAQDLTGRPPIEKEWEALEKGATLRQMVDYYLNTEDFRRFYFHRIRLFLESHGTEEDDEPVRLWCYIAFRDRPFTEILTADYTVDSKMRPVKRPAYYGRTGLLTMKGFIKGKPGLPHFNYAAVVLEKFLGYVFEVPAEIVNIRQTVTAAATTEPGSACYSCHKLLTPLAYQRLRWTDQGEYRSDPNIDDSDRGVVPSYPFKGAGMEAFATQAVKKERFLRTIIDTHFLFFTGRNLRWHSDERGLYRRLYDAVHRNGLTIKSLIRAIVLSPEYLYQKDPQPQRSSSRLAAKKEE
ncbi:MAG: hypothetical protein NZ959_08395 [Armatimonadetes bacterium]|nr:hypothetical protein [Armatimonadota bacterium]MDW8122460.1 hypothetical protein [Armatimonadota bacterium]